VEETPCLSIYAKVANEEMGVTVAEAFHEVAEHIISNNGTLDGAPFVYYHGFDDKTTSMECGWPVWQEAPESGSIKRFTIPGGEAVTTRYMGPYEGLIDAYQKLMEFLTIEGLKAGPMWEYYLNSPDEVAAEELVTEIFWLME